MAVERALRLAIDSRPAEDGSRRVVRSLDDIRKKATEAAGSVEKAEGSLKRFKSAADGLQSAGRKMTTFVTLPVLGAGAAFVKMASDAQETRAKFDAVFKGLSASTRAWAADLGTSLGRNQVELEGFLARLQDTFVPLGFARERAADLSKTMTQLGIDLAAFDNSSEAEAIDLLTSALVGNHEAVRRFGISLTEATMKAELYRMGVKGGAQAATEQEKVQARLNIIMNASADAQGAAAREADGSANSFRGLASAAKDASIALGERLLPIVTPMVKGLRDMLQGVGSLNPEWVKWGIAIAGTLAVVGPLALGLGSVAGALFLIATASSAVVAAWTGGLSLVLTGLAAYWAKSKLDAAEAASEVDNYAASLRKLEAAGHSAQTRTDLNIAKTQLAVGQERGTLTAPQQARLTLQIAQLENRLLKIVPPSADPATGGGTGVVDPTIAEKLSDAFKALLDSIPTPAEARSLFAAGRSDALLRNATRDQMRFGRTSIEGAPGQDRILGLTANAIEGLDLSTKTGPALSGSGGSVGPGYTGGGISDFLGGLKSSAMSLMSSFGPMAIAAAAVSQIFSGLMEVLGPILKELAEPLKMIGRLVGASIAPGLKILAPVLEAVAEAFSYVTEAVGWLVRAIGKAVNFLLPGNPANGLVEWGQSMMDAARASRDAATAADSLSAAISPLTTDIPKAINLALYRQRYGTGAGAGTAPGSSLPMGATPGGTTSDTGEWDRYGDRGYSPNINMGGVTIVSSGGESGEALLKKLERAVADRAARGAPTFMPGVRTAA